MVFQQEAAINLQSIPPCKSHTTSGENLLDLISSDSLIFALVADNS